MTSRLRTWDEVNEMLGAEAVAASDRLAADAPPLNPTVYAELAVILRRDPTPQADVA